MHHQHTSTAFCTYGYLTISASSWWRDKMLTPFSLSKGCISIFIILLWKYSYYASWQVASHTLIYIITKFSSWCYIYYTSASRASRCTNFIHFSSPTWLKSHLSWMHDTTRHFDAFQRRFSRHIFSLYFWLPPAIEHELIPRHIGAQRAVFPSFFYDIARAPLRMRCALRQPSQPKRR